MFELGIVYCCSFTMRIALCVVLSLWLAYIYIYTYNPENVDCKRNYIITLN